jgi:NAD(P)-dependent dehydrogenase (short-subunit alcohol dehydrogenase family)
MDLDLRGRKAIVTGGTKGIGRAIVETLVREGVDVAFCARSGAEVDAAVSALSGKGVKVIGRALNVAGGKALARWVSDVGEALGGIDIVIPSVSALATGDDMESWKLCHEVDLMHTVNTVAAAMPYLERSGAGAIVTISSVSGREVDFAAGPYGVFKAALIHYTKGLSFRLASKNIRANVVSPGDTFCSGGFWDNIKRDDPVLFEQSLALNPMGRMAQPQEIANAVVFLASPAASFITGTNLVADGALTRGVQF